MKFAFEGLSREWNQNLAKTSFSKKRFFTHKIDLLRSLETIIHYFKERNLKKLNIKQKICSKNNNDAFLTIYNKFVNLLPSLVILVGNLRMLDCVQEKIYKI